MNWKWLRRQIWIATILAAAAGAILMVAGLVATNIGIAGLGLILAVGSYILELRMEKRGWNK